MSLRVTALLDTGATGTGIRADLVEALALQPKGQRRIVTANGMIWAAEVLFRIGFLAGDYDQPGFDAEAQQPYVLEKHVTGFELQRGFDYAMLVGMDVLGQCDLHVLRNGKAELALP